MTRQIIERRACGTYVYEYPDGSRETVSPMARYATYLNGK